MKAAAASFAAGAIFAIGLGLSGMTRPAKVLAFLDVTGDWDPSLAMVMIGAIAVHAVSFRLIRKRSSPLLEPNFALPDTVRVDGRLVAGAALFGVGWGMAGYCPGPALTAFGGGSPAGAVFVPAMIAGMLLFRVSGLGRERERDG